MKTLWRYLRLLLQKQPALAPDQMWCTQLRVWPSECDINLHLNNAVYHSWLDIARTDYLFRLGALKLILTQRWVSVLASQSISFIREIKPLARVTIKSRMIHHDEKYLYFEHGFYVKEVLHAKAVSRMALLKRGKVRPINDFLRAREALGYPPLVLKHPQQPPKAVAAKLALLDAKRTTSDLEEWS